MARSTRSPADSDRKSPGALDPPRSGEHTPPFLIPIELKLYYRDGFEVLEWIRGQPALARVEVVILTGSGEARD